MPAYNFKQQFADKVAHRIKRQTIRAERKDGYVPEPGALFIGYAGMRTKNCRKLVESRVSEVIPVSIKRDRIWLAGRELDNESAHSLALLDGFENAKEMLAWFNATHGDDFAGHVIRWL